MKSISHVLKKEFARRKAKNAAYTLRAFAKFLNIDHSLLSKIMREERSPGKEFIAKVGERLGLSEEEILRFQKRKASAKKMDYFVIDDEVFGAIADYKYDVLVELIKTEDFKPDFQWLGRKIGCSAKAVEGYVEVLVSLGFLEITPNGEWRDTTKGSCLFVPSLPESKPRKKYQKELLEVSAKSLEGVPDSQRVHTSMIMASNRKKIEEAKKMIIKFRDKLCAFLEDCDDKEVIFCLQTSLFPVIEE